MTNIELRGTVVAGRGLGAAVMGMPGVLARSLEHFGFEAAPGTLNLRMAAPLDRRLLPRYLPADDIAPELAATTGQAGYFWAPVLIATRFRGIAFQADEPGYPENQVELICEAHLRDELNLRDGDVLPFEILDAATGSSGEQS